MPRLSVSIVVPTYDRAHLVGRALQSALNQCEPDDEIIVVDDGSTDGTDRVVAGFRGVRYERIAHGGAGKARNTGVALARHPLIAFLDSDDEFLPGTLECKRALMSARTDLVLCFSNFSGQPVDGPLETGCLIYWSRDPRDWSEILGPGTLLSRLVLRNGACDPIVHIGSMYRAEMASSYIAANTAIVNRQLAGDALAFPEDLPTYEDWECFGRVAGRGPCAYLAFDSALQHGHRGPRLTDAAIETQIRTRLMILERVWGRDREFLAAHADQFARVCAEQRLIGARAMLVAGRTEEARAFLRDVPGGPLWARLARHVAVPAVAVKLWRGTRRRRDVPIRTLTEATAGALSTDLVASGSPAYRELLPEWRTLWVQAPDREPYSHPGWVEAYWAAFEPAARTFVFTVRLGGQLVAVLPLIRESTVVDGMPVRMLRAPMNPHSFRIQLLTAPDATMRVPCAICDHLAAMPGWDLLTIGRFARDGAADRLGRCVRSHGFPTMLQSHWPTRYIAIHEAAADGTDEPWLEQADPDLKKKLRRSWRQVAQAYRAEPVLETRDAADPAQLARFYDIEASGWKGREGTAIKCAPNTLQFYNDLARAFAADGVLRLHFLSVEGITLAGAFSVVAGCRLFVLKWSYDEAYAKYRPGLLLSREMQRDCSRHGVQEMDLGEDADYKREWTPLTQDHESLYVFNRTLYGRLLYGYRDSLRPAVASVIHRIRRAVARDNRRDRP